MRVLVANPGSSSLKLSIVDNERTVDRHTIQGWDGVPDQQVAMDFYSDKDAVDAIGVRVVHGGDRRGPSLLTDKELKALQQFTPLAPLHQPRSLRLAESLQKWFPQTPLIGCYDTAFHADLPTHAATYPIPREWTHKYGIRRYGFHGLSCANALRYTSRLLNRHPATISLICCHLGSGVSVTAIERGVSVDTSMGFTPLDGTVMATRPGELDPGLLTYLWQELPEAEVISALNSRCGLAGMSGTDGDIRAVLAKRSQGCAEAALAIAVYLHRLRRQIAAAMVSLTRLDALVLTGGVAEHQPQLCSELLSGLRFFGLEKMGTQLLAIQADEDLEIAREVGQFLDTKGKKR